MYVDEVFHCPFKSMYITKQLRLRRQQRLLEQRQSQQPGTGRPIKKHDEPFQGGNQ